MENEKIFDITEEEMDKFLDEIIKEQEKREKEIIEFKQNRENEVVEEIYTYLLNDENKYVDDEEMLYFPKKYKFTSKEFDMLFSNLEEYARNNKLSGYEEDNPFDNYNYYLKYKDMNILLRVMNGQGTSVQMRTDLEKYWDEIKSFSWEDYKNNEI